MKSNMILFLVVILAVCLTQFASDIYAPSMPSIASSLGVSIDLVQFSMAIYMLGVAVSQLIYGPLSEGIGRKGPLITGLSIMLVGSLICSFAPTIELLITGRLVQGCGAGACAALWRSVFRDVFTGDELAKFGSYLVIFVTFIVPAAPLLGGFLQESYGWRSNFTFMTGYTVIALLAIILGFKETSQHHHLERLKLSFVGKTYLSLLTSRIFMGMSLAVFLGYGAFFAWFIVGPVLLIEGLGITPVTFGYITFFGGGAAYGLAGYLNGKLVTRFKPRNMMRFGWSVMILSGLLMLTGYYFVGMKVWAIAGPSILFYFGSTFIWPNAFATAFTPFGKIAGYTGSLYGFMTLGGAAILGAIMSGLPHQNQLCLALIILCASTLSWLTYEIIVPKTKALEK